LGDKLAGLSDDARGTALDWCAQIKASAQPPRTLRATA
jgi:hypothetical protein